MRYIWLTTLSLCAALLFAPTSWSQQPPTPPLPPTTPYGAPITLEQAKKAAEAALAEARKRNQSVAVAIVEPSGSLVYFLRMDGTQYASVENAQAKALSAALFRRSSKSFRERVTAGDLSPMALRGAVASDGGVPIVVDGKVIGAIGISGGADDALAQAGADALK